MKIISAAILSPEQKKSILNLWNNEYPEQLKFENILALENYLKSLKGAYHLIIEDENGHIFGWAFSFERESERWFAIIVNSKIQKQGYGARLLQRLKEKEQILNGWVIDHARYSKKNREPYLSPLAFYLKNNFEVLPGIRLEIEILSAVKIRWQQKEEL
jgi:GNAT superfamily N-acetyltransferase